MADDGMLLNFELPSDAFAPKKTFTGGSWKDRLTAKKSAEWGRKKELEQGAARRIPRFEEVLDIDQELVLPNSRPTKRVRTDESRDARGTAEGVRRSMQQPAKEREVISSLFSYNPASVVSQRDQVAQGTEEVSPSNAPLQDELATFTNLGLSATLANHLLKKLELKTPTAIQRKAVQQLCTTDSDAFIQAETGSGKTLAYLLPVVQRLSQLSQRMKDAGQDFNRDSGMFAVVLAPTRELAKQINAVLEELLSCCNWIVGGIVIGGEKKKSEKARLRKGVNILVATPGRLADHLNNTEVLDVSRVRWLVLDEGDRLMELGFEQDIQKIVGTLNLRSRKVAEKPVPGLPERRTTVLCSATLKADVDKLRTIVLKDAVSIAVDSKEALDSEIAAKSDIGFSAPAQLKQSYALVPAKQRLVTLVAALKQAFKRKGTTMKCVVFISCADSVDFHFELLTRAGSVDEARSGDQDERHDMKTRALSRSDKIPQGSTIAESRTQGRAIAFSSEEDPVQLFRLHGSLQQATRTSTLKAFTKCADPAVLVCTDVASRGLDLPNVDLVIEYDPPFSKDDHLHRIGRTARAGKDGRAMIFLMPGCEEGYVDTLKEGKPRNITRHVASELLKKGYTASVGVVTERGWEDAATDWQLDVERWALEHPKHLEQARRAFQSHIRAYATHVAAERHIFDMKQMHLGHLAKAFALRDKPASIRVPGQRPGKDAGNKSKDARKALAGKSASHGTKHLRDDNFDNSVTTDEQEARKKMREKVKAISGGVSEFNLG